MATDYEQKYKEALERARKLYNDAKANEYKSDMEDYESIFPELVESEDEKIRKDLKDFLWRIANGEMNDRGTMPSAEKCQEWFAYLEKQKDLDKMIVVSPEVWDNAITDAYENGKRDSEKQKENPKSADSISSNCVSDAKCENRWHKVTDSLPDNGRLVLANDCLGNILLARYDGEGNWEVSVYDDDDYYCRNTITKWCDIPSEKQKEQKPVPPLPPFDEMSPEDKWNHPLYLEGFDMGRDVQKVFDEQKPVERSLEDSRIIGFVYALLNQIEWKDNWAMSKDECLRRLNNYRPQKPAEWSEEDDAYRIEAVKLLENPSLYESCPNLRQETIEWLKQLPKVSVNSEWSEEDEYRIRQIERIAQQAGCTQKLQEEIHDWLKSLRPQQRQEWSEEEKEILDSILSHYVLIDKPIDANGIPKEKYISLIKSLRFDTYKNCNSHWKPSEEQMDALHRCVDYLHGEGSGYFDPINSLYEQLKKL